MSFDLLQEHVDSFSREGFFIAEDFISEDSLKICADQLEELWSIAKKNQISKIRVYDDYPYFLGGVNVSAIEDPFFYAPNLKDLILQANLPNFISALTNWPGASLELARIHMNDRFIYRGFWHRDALIDEINKSIVMVMYFKDEEGFRILPAHHKTNRDSCLGDELQAKHYAGGLEGERIVSVKAGSILIMKSYLLHRGFTKKSRLHLHLRFVKSSSFDPEDWIGYRNKEALSYDFQSSNIVRRFINLLGYLKSY